MKRQSSATSQNGRRGKSAIQIAVRTLSYTPLGGASPSRARKQKTSPMIPWYDKWTWRRYVLRLGRRHGVAGYAWWHGHIDRIVAGLQGRYEIVKLGEDPGPPDMLFKSIWNRDPRPIWIAHKKVGWEAASRYALLDIVACIDNRAKKEREHASDGNS